MEKIINLHIEKLPEGYYLATTNDLQGLVVRGNTIAETLKVARDVAQKLIKSQENIALTSVSESFDYPLLISQ